MARYLYGGTAADVTTTQAGRLVTGATLTVWDSQSGGTQITDLQDATGTAATVVTSDAYGRVLFYGPDNDTRSFWLESNVGGRVLVRPAASIMPANDSVDTVHLKNGSVTSAKIADGTIVDADIAAGAAIAKTKVAGTAITAADSGTVTSAMLADGTIADADISGSAAIALSKLAADAWQTYTPTVTATGTNPSGWTLAGRYMQVGKLVVARFAVTAAGASMGSGAYRIALPVAAASNYPAGGTFIGTCYFEKAGSTGYIGWAHILNGGTYLQVGYMGANSTLVNYMGATTQPFTWAANDFCTGEIVYEAA